jgi:hypothetical protein
MDADRLFLERCQQIENLQQSDREIDLLDMAAHLRQLLLDDAPLVHKVNRSRRIKLKFQVGDFRAPPPDAFTVAMALEDGLDPETRAPGGPTKEVNFDGLIRHVVLYLKGRPHSVAEVVQLAANVAGGVHLTENPDKKRALIAKYSSLFALGGLPAGIRQLKAIARVSLRGLAPLIEAVKKG